MNQSIHPSRLGLQYSYLIPTSYVGLFLFGTLRLTGSAWLARFVLQSSSWAPRRAEAVHHGSSHRGTSRPPEWKSHLDKETEQHEAYAKEALQLPIGNENDEHYPCTVEIYSVKLAMRGNVVKFDSRFFDHQSDWRIKGAVDGVSPPVSQHRSSVLSWESKVSRDCWQRQAAAFHNYPKATIVFHLRSGVAEKFKLSAVEQRLLQGIADSYASPTPLRV